MSFETRDIPGQYDGIWACASLLLNYLDEGSLKETIERLRRT